MPGFNTATLTNKVRNGNTVGLLAGDQLVGFGQTFGLRLGTGLEQIYGIGSQKPQDNQQLKFAPSLTLSTLQLTPAGLTFYGQSSTWLEVIAGNTFTFCLYDNDGNIILSYVGATCDDWSSSIPANQPVTEDMTFMALDVLGPNGVSVLNGNSAETINALSSTGVQFVT